MKHLKYYTILILSMLCILVPALGAVAIIYTENWILLVPEGILILICYLISKPLGTARGNARHDVEYDEFGMSKSKGSYDKLSKAERDAIDLQRTADMERVLNSTALKKQTKQGSLDPEKDMNEMIGLTDVKDKMREMVARMEFDRSNKKDKGKDQDENSMSGRHMIFYGSPGTGKTTVARILTGFLYKYGYIKQNKCVEVDGDFLKAGADTALKTEMVVRQAYDGVLFIDEAYTLTENGDGTGADAVAELIKQMEDHRDRFILILAGYTQEMRYLLQTNPGFESRIKEYLVFPDYSNEEMLEIFKLMAKNEGFFVSDDASTAFNERIQKERRSKYFGNARTARNILDEAMDKHALNFVDNKLDKGDKYVLRGIDISTELKKKGFT